MATSIEVFRGRVDEAVFESFESTEDARDVVEDYLDVFRLCPSSRHVGMGNHALHGDRSRIRMADIPWNAARRYDDHGSPDSVRSPVVTNDVGVERTPTGARHATAASGFLVREIDTLRRRPHESP